MNKTIYLIRHGQTDYNKRNIIQGSGVDSDLNETGRNQAKAFHQAYKNINFEALFISGLKRTQQTVQPFIEGGMKPEKWEQLNEMNWGIHEGKPSSPTMIANYRKLIQAWNQGDFEQRVPQGESAFEMGSRLNEFIQYIKGRTEQRILVCSHGRAIRCLISLFKNGNLSTMEQHKHHNTGLYIIEQKDTSFQLQVENNFEHLKDVQ